MTSIQVENLSKAYQLGQIGTGTISRDLERFWTTKILGKEDPFLKIGQTNNRTQKGSSDIVWSLKDINFEIKQGDAVGIIGRNGAGKSTLLKLLSRVTSPTTGTIKVKGRVASLLEVGTGFHPELSGRENIFLNGAILGMRKKEIKHKFDEIVDFAGVERYIDTPVKRYSSGMYVRLAFAVAAHLESEILIVDEVLAVGDAEFQKKCLGKMGDISKGEGRTVLFVSHNMDSIKNLCNKGIVLENGLLTFNSTEEKAINYYLNTNNKKEVFVFENDEIIFNEILLSNVNNIQKLDFFNGEEIFINILFTTKVEQPKIGFCIAIYDYLNNLVTAINTYHIQEDIENLDIGKKNIKIEIPKYILNSGQYKINIHFNDMYGNLFKIFENVENFIIVDDLYRRGKYYRGLFPGQISLIPKIKIEKYV